MPGKNRGGLPLGNQILADGLRTKLDVGAAVAQRPPPHAPVEVVRALALKKFKSSQKLKKNMILVSFLPRHFRSRIRGNQSP